MLLSQCVENYLFLGKAKGRRRCSLTAFCDHGLANDTCFLPAVVDVAGLMSSCMGSMGSDFDFLFRLRRMESFVSSLKMLVYREMESNM